MPNLERCEQLPSRHSGTVQLFQRAFSQTVFWRVEAAVVLEARTRRAGGSRELEFRMISGDFADLYGRWVVREDPDRPGVASALQYEITFTPDERAQIPRQLAVFLMKRSLPGNMLALAARAEALAQEQGRAPAQAAAEAALAAGPAPVADVPVRQRGPSENNVPGWLPERRPVYLGVNSVPIPSSSARAVDAMAVPVLHDTGSKRSNAIQSRVSAAAAPLAGALPRSYERVPGTDGHSSTQVHIRRLDVDGRLHRRLLASIHVHATPGSVWRVLTDYERLPEVVPTILASEVLPPPAARPQPENMRRLKQLAVKQLPYVQLHTEVVLDVLEKPGKDVLELQFKHHTSDFDVLQGKWVLQRRANGTTDVKYAVELAMRAAPFAALDLVDPLLERAIVEDVPAALAAIKRVAEGGAVRVRDAAGIVAMREIDTFDVLRAELTVLFGDTMMMPDRRTLLQHGREDLAAAIPAFGGYKNVAERLNWERKIVRRRKRGFWQNSDNLRNELDKLADEEGYPRGTIPTKATLEALERWDLTKAMERRGGFIAVMQQLGYEMHSVQTARARGTKLAGRGGQPPPHQEMAEARRHASTRKPTPAARILGEDSSGSRRPGAGRLEPEWRGAGRQRLPSKMQLSRKELDEASWGGGGRAPQRRLSQAQLDKLMQDTADSADQL